MTLDEAAAHMDGPVLAFEGDRPHDGRIVNVDPERRLVQVEVRDKRTLRWSGRRYWYAPCHLQVPRWFTDRRITSA